MAVPIEALIDAQPQGYSLSQPFYCDPDLFALVEQTMAYKGHVDWRYHAGP